jgi:Domain of unknown function (DUF4823)
MRFGSAIGLVLLLLAACADTHYVVRSSGASQSTALARGGNAYVAVSNDGRYGNTLYSGSGAMASQAVSAAFAPFMRSITVSPKPEEFDQALQSAKSGNYTYLIYPQILHWEDRATEWSAKPDVAFVKVSIINARTAEVIDSAIINGKSGLATFGGDKPQDLIPKPLSEYAASLFK